MRPVDLLRTGLYSAYSHVPASEPLLRRFCEAAPVRITGGPARRMYISGLPLRNAQMYDMVQGQLEPMVQEAIRRRLQPGGVFYDVGANLGYFSLVASALGAATVHAFEPHPRTASHLRETFARNGLSGAAHELAVADYDGESQLSDVPEAGWSHLEDRVQHPQRTGAFDVRVARLDSLDLEPPHVIKVDTEGYERSVLDGAAELIAEHRPALILEMHGNNEEVADWLRRHDYVADNLEGLESIVDAGPVHILATAVEARD